jgi:hypothetical protein
MLQVWFSWSVCAKYAWYKDDCSTTGLNQRQETCNFFVSNHAQATIIGNCRATVTETAVRLGINVTNPWGKPLA